MRLELETLTPVHIGTGEEISPMKYVVHQDFVKVVELYKLFRDDNFNVNGFLEYVDTCIKNKRIPYLGFFDKERIHNKYIEYSIKLRANLNEKRLLNIKESVNVNGRFYIPGSSIKGSILSAIYWKKLKEMSEEQDKREIIIGCLTKNFKAVEKHKKKYPYFIPRSRLNPEAVLTNMVFYSIIDEEEKKHYMRKKGKIKIKFAPWLMVGDTSFTTNASVIEVKTFGAKAGGKGIPIVYEVLDSGTKLDFEIKAQKTKLSEAEILRIADEFYSMVLKKEMEWGKNRDIEIEVCGEDEKYKLRLGQGSSVLATSLLILAEELGVKKYYLKKWGVTPHGNEPRTRKIFFDGKKSYPLGWIRIREK